MAQSSSNSLKRKHSEMQSSTDPVHSKKGNEPNEEEAPPLKKQKHDSNDSSKDDAIVTHGVTTYGLTKRQQRRQERTGFTQKERNMHRRKQKLENKRKRNRETLEAMTEEEKEKHFKDKYEKRMLKRQQKEIHNKKLMDASTNGMKVCIDLCFNRQFHKDMEYTNLLKQLCYCWNANKLAKHSVALHLIGADEHWNKHLRKQGIVSWKGIHIHPNTDILECFANESKQNFVYLSPDSDVVLNEKEFRKNTNIYIIGGIVDRVIHKNLSLDRAKALGIRHCKLPLHRLKDLEGRQCLNVNAVFQILLRFQNEEERWDDIMDQEIPNRNRQSTQTRKQRRKVNKASNENDVSEDTSTV